MSLYVVWGVTLCAFRCMRPAQVIVDHQPLCVFCADRWLERATVTHPEVLAALPPLVRGEEERGAWRPTVKLVDERAPEDSPELDELRRQWQAFQERAGGQLELA